MGTVDIIFDVADVHCTSATSKIICKFICENVIKMSATLACSSTFSNAFSFVEEAVEPNRSTFSRLRASLANQVQPKALHVMAMGHTAGYGGCL